MKQLLVMLSLFAALPAFAQTAPSSWVLVRKIAGPPSWTCANNAVLGINGDKLQLDRVMNNQVVMLSLNGAPICSSLSSQSPLGGVTCQQSSANVANGTTTFARYSCEKLGAWHNSCDPMKEQPSVVIQIANGMLRVTETINWQNNPYFSCEYALKK